MRFSKAYHVNLFPVNSVPYSFTAPASFSPSICSCRFSNTVHVHVFPSCNLVKFAVSHLHKSPLQCTYCEHLHCLLFSLLFTTKSGEIIWKYIYYILITYNALQSLCYFSKHSAWPFNLSCNACNVASDKLQQCLSVQAGPHLHSGSPTACEIQVTSLHTIQKKFLLWIELKKNLLSLKSSVPRVFEMEIYSKWIQNVLYNLHSCLCCTNTFPQEKRGKLT